MTHSTVVVLSLIAISLILAGQSFARIDKQSIMGIWLFEDKGDVAKDSSTNGNDGKINGPKSVKGKFGMAFEFDGQDDWVEVLHKNCNQH